MSWRCVFDSDGRAVTTPHQLDHFMGIHSGDQQMKRPHLQKSTHFPNAAPYSEACCNIPCGREVGRSQRANEHIARVEREFEIWRASHSTSHGRHSTSKNLSATQTSMQLRRPVAERHMAALIDMMLQFSWARRECACFTLVADLPLDDVQQATYVRWRHGLSHAVATL